MKKENIKKVVLAYSGGLDTSIIIPWLKENYNNCEVVAVSGDVGQGTELDGLEEKAKATGASKLYVLDLKKDFVENYIFPTLKFGAKYEDYLLGTSFARPCIAKALADIAIKEGADAICHGCTGKGNDQVRFELSAKALDPSIRVIAPWREWDLMSRTALNAFAEANGIPISKGAKRYSMDANMLHTSFEGSELEDPGLAPDPVCHERCVPMEQAPDTPEEITVDFEKGNPVAFNGKRLSPYEIIHALELAGGRNGVGRSDIVENRYVGMKCRGVYENPAGTILYKLHQDLEGLCLDRELLSIRDQLVVRYSEAVYNGYWYSPEREAMQAFMDKAQETVTGQVRAKLYKGGVWPLCRTSPYSLFNKNLATFEASNYDHHDAAGFIKLNSLRLVQYANVKKHLQESK